MASAGVSAGFSIRPLSVSDYPSMCALWDADGYRVRSLQDGERVTRSFLARNGAYCFGAVSDGELVGFIMVGCDGRSARVYHLVIRSEHRRLGVAHALTEAAWDVLKAEGVCGVVVFREDPSVTFWESEGFKDRDDLSLKASDDF